MWMSENQETLNKYFRADLFPGSLNVDIDSAGASLHLQLDRAEPSPAFTIPRRELRAMSPYLGDGQAWRISLSAARISPPHECWVFRRIGSKVPANVLEIVSTVAIVPTFGLRHGEDLELVFLTSTDK
jgi:CTP-dependent riboflavin kinase